MKLFVRGSDLKAVRKRVACEGGTGDTLLLADIKTHWFDESVVVLDKGELKALLARVAAGQITKHPEKIINEIFGEQK